MELSHDAHVLAGSFGSSSRTKKLNNMCDILDREVAKAREDEHEQIKVSSFYLADELNWSQSTICRNGFPNFFDRHFESCRYRENKGLYIDVDMWVEERKKQRKHIKEIKENRGGGE